MDRRSIGERVLVLLDVKRGSHHTRHPLRAVLGCLRAGWLVVDDWRLVLTDAGERRLAQGGHDA